MTDLPRCTLMAVTPWDGWDMAANDNPCPMDELHDLVCEAMAGPCWFGERDAEWDRKHSRAEERARYRSEME